MKNYFSQLQEYLQLKANNITIKQANFYVTLVIFVFTAIFAFLLIEENYYDYERTLLDGMITKNVEIQAGNFEELKKTKLKTLLIKNTIAIVTLAFLLFTIVLGLNKIFNTILQRDTEAFLRFFEDFANDTKVFNPHAIFFKDFDVMVGYASKMVETISEQKRTLTELNLTLEDKIKKKTANLLEANKKLELEKKFSEDIVDAQKEFLRYAIHETNTPLSVILTSIELSVMQNGKNRQLSKIEAATKNIFNIYDDLSYLVKKDQISYPKISIDLEQFLNSRIDFFTEVAQMSKVSFSYFPHAKNSYIYFNETKLQRIIDNTITNAIKYTLAHETIFVKLDANGVFLEMSVGSKSKAIKDTDRIFDAYYREEQLKDGFGLGLKLVRNICDEENVLISIDSDDDKTTFTYKFKMMGA